MHVVSVSQYVYKKQKQFFFFFVGCLNQNPREIKEIGKKNATTTNKQSGFCQNPQQQQKKKTKKN